MGCRMSHLYLMSRRKTHRDDLSRIHCRIILRYGGVYGDDYFRRTAWRTTVTEYLSSNVHN